MGRHSKLGALGDLVTGAVFEQDDALRERPELKLTDRRLEAVAKWSQNPWSFLTGVDPDTQEAIVKTTDQRDKRNPIKAFPKHLEYVRYLVDLLESEPYIQIEKASQMIVSTTILLLSAWRCAFKPSYKVLLSKHKEEEASLLLKEKVGDVWARMPEWLQHHYPCRVKPAHKAVFDRSQSHMLGLPENAAKADARGQTYQTGLIDEAEFQEVLSDILTAMMPRASQIVFWSTPSNGGAGAHTFRSYLANDPIKIHPGLVALNRKYVHVKGMSTRRNEDKGFTIVRIEHTADPAKRSKEWEDQARRGYPSDTDFRREMKIDRRSNAGRPFYPAFAEHPERYTRYRFDTTLAAPVVRGWDFGGRNPACVWGQWSKKSRRFYVMREILGKDIDTYGFRDLVKYLSGQLSYDSLESHPRAIELLQELRYDRAYPQTPWFEGNHHFLDFAGHEAVRPGPGLVRAADPKIAAEILALGEIYVTSTYVFQKSRKQIIDALCKLRSDGKPGIFIDPACPNLTKGLCGEIVYAKSTAANADPNEPAKDALYSHLHEALGYALVNTVTLEHAEYMTSAMDAGVGLSEEAQESVSSYLSGGW
jgi:hypothetical protein